MDKRTWTVRDGRVVEVESPEWRERMMRGNEGLYYFQTKAETLLCYATGRYCLTSMYSDNCFDICITHRGFRLCMYVCICELGH